MRALTIILLTIVLPSFYASASDNVEYWLRQLDKSLESKDNYENAKKQRIARLRRSLDSVADPLGQYKILYRLFEEYKSYRNDSAMIYAGRCMDTAGKTGSYGIEAEARNLPEQPDEELERMELDGHGPEEISQATRYSI